MLRSNDGLIEIEVAQSFSSVVFYPSDWSIINLPLSVKEASTLFANLYNMPTSKHISLVLCRHKKKDKLSAMANLGCLVRPIGSKKKVRWEFLDSVSIWYEKPSSCSSHGLLPIAESGFIIYKGNPPEVAKTSWFSDDKKSNATNLWNVAPQENEGPYTYYHKFSWELQLLMRSMSGQLETRRFTYAAKILPTEMVTLRDFCKQYMLTAHLYAENDIEAQSLMLEVNK